MRLFKFLVMVLILSLFSPIVILAAENNLSVNEKASNNYVLPYPGILPDHPLYLLKVFRDRIYDFLLADTLKKANFKLLMADKRMAMAQILKDKDKQPLAEVTISKASKYYEEAALLLKKSQQEGKDTNDLKDKLFRASLKYQEIIINFQKYTSPEIKNGLEESITRVIKNSGQ